MKPKFFIFFLLSLLSISSYAQKADIEILRKHLTDDALIHQGYRPRIEVYIKSDYGKTGDYLESMNSNGGWNDVDYTDRDNNWAPLAHLDRLMVMTYNFRKDTSQWFQNKTLLKGIEKAIQYWYQVNPECDNWYKNRIAKQFYFNVIALLLDGRIDASLEKKMINDLTETPTMTGSNRTLLATSTFYRGVLENNPEMIQQGVSGVTDQIKITTKEGVQPDYSFHQHGHFLYNGSYGLNYLRESAWMATIVNGTQFAFPEKDIKILRDYYLNGTRWMIRGGLIDYNVRGRQVGRGDAMKLYGDVLVPILDRMITANPEYANVYQTSQNRIIKQLPQIKYGHKHFWRSDYTIHHRQAYSTSLKMCSERTIGIETNMNTENKLGYWLPYGLTYIYRRGNEYEGIFPAWDWARLPGVTCPHIEIEGTTKGPDKTQHTSFVGGVSDGKYGVSAMDFSKNQTTAKKAWFWFDDEWVALGAGITSTHDSTIVTGINQVLQNGPVTVDGQLFAQGKRTLNHPKWILQDSVGYVFPVDETIQLKAEVQKGNMQRIYGLGKDTVYAPEVFSLWIDHGIKPKNATYEYIVVPATGETTLTEYAEHIPVTILSNTSQLQAVSNTKTGCTGIAFYKAGKCTVNANLSIKVNKPVLLLYDARNQQISVSDPTTKLTNAMITVAAKNKKNQRFTVDFPTEGFAGKSVILNLN